MSFDPELATLTIAQEAAEQSRMFGWTGLFRAILGNGEDPAIVVVPPTDREFAGAMYCYAPTLGGQIFQVANTYPGITYDNDAAGLPVVVGYPPGGGPLSIMGPDTFAAGVSYGGALPSQFEGIRNKIVTPNRFETLRIYPISGMEIGIKAGYWIDGQTLEFVTEQSLGDLTSSIPGTSGKAVYALICVDAANSMTVVLGSEYDASTIPGIESAAPTAIASSSIATAIIKLYNGQTSVAETDVYHLPQLVSRGAGTGVSSSTLYDNTLSADGFWDITSISQSFQHLRLLIRGKCDTNAAELLAAIEFNADTTSANYQYDEHKYGASHTTTSSADNFVGRFPPSDEANYMGTLTLDIPFYTDAYYKHAFGHFQSWTSAVEYTAHIALIWENTAAISRITFVDNVGLGRQFEAGSRVQLIGVNYA